MSMASLDGHSQSVDMVALSEGTPRVATLDHEGVPRLWVTNGTNQAIQSVVLKDRTGPANVIALSRDGKWLVAGCKDGEVRLWHLVGVDKPVPGESLAGHSKDVVSVAFDENSRRQATADDGGGVRVWDMASPRPFSSARRADRPLRVRAVPGLQPRRPAAGKREPRWFGAILEPRRCRSDQPPDLPSQVLSTCGCCGCLCESRRTQDRDWLLEWHRLDLERRRPELSTP